MCDKTISIIVPVFNVEEYLDDCLASLLQQNLEDYEIICVDDGSEDNSMAILKLYEEQSDKIRVLKNERNVGLSASRNRGMKVARGEYLWFVDSDDYVEVNCLNTIYSTAKENDLDILLFNMERNWERTDADINQFKNSTVTDGAFFFEFVISNGCLATACNQIIKKEYLDGLNFRFAEGILHEDLLYIPYTMIPAKRVRSLKNAFYKYRKRENSITHKMSQKRLYSFYYIIEELIGFWKSNSFSDSLNQCYRRYVAILYRTCKSMGEELGNPVLLDTPNPAIGFFYNLIERANSVGNELVNVSEELVARLRNEKEIYIYGAGVYGQTLAEKLEELDIFIQGFVVTEHVSQSVIKGIPVFEISSIKNIDSCFAIAVSRKYQNEIIETLKEKGYSNYLLVANYNCPMNFNGD